MSARLMVLNGPNLNLLGVREPHLYGRATLEQIERGCEAFAQTIGATLEFHQSNHEGVLVDLIQAARERADALIVNPAAFSFTSFAMFDALKLFEGPVIELHITNIHAREEAYHHSRISAVATAVICGMGAYGYIVAMQCAARMLDALPETLPTGPAVAPRAPR